MQHENHKSQGLMSMKSEKPKKMPEEIDMASMHKEMKSKIGEMMNMMMEMNTMLEAMT